MRFRLFFQGACIGDSGPVRRSWRVRWRGLERSRLLRETGTDSGLGSTRQHPDGYGEFKRSAHSVGPGWYDLPGPIMAILSLILAILGLILAILERAGGMRGAIEFAVPVRVLAC